ncbi:hypothetical protein BDN67DRAFT_183081 [Paxillus ammoniavirescens]|nr:hypothetical protein BDN67DRAFT_183081 [Paxillus ammoniavirescens]
MPLKVLSMAVARTRRLRSAIALNAIFQRDIQGAAPDFRPFDQPETYKPSDYLEPEDFPIVGNPAVQTMGVYDVRKTIQEFIAWELPHNIPHAAKIHLTSQSTGPCTAPAEQCLTAINNVLDDVI